MLTTVSLYAFLAYFMNFLIILAVNDGYDMLKSFILLVELYKLSGGY